MQVTIDNKIFVKFYTWSFINECGMRSFKKIFLICLLIKNLHHIQSEPDADTTDRTKIFAYYLTS